VVPSGVDQAVQKVADFEDSRQSAELAAYRARRFAVSGIDDLGDVHIFATDDPERAREIVGIMGEELLHVKPSELTYGRPAAPDERRNDADPSWEGMEWAQ
jgi:hypothetical protein